jgi:hypothetical protein
MPYRNKTYVALDFDNDKSNYFLMKAWKQNDDIDFNFHNAHDLTTIRTWSSEEAKKRSLHERMLNSKLFILLVGEKTNNCNVYVRWEIEQALKMGLPIIAVNLNDLHEIDEVRCPAILRPKLAIHVPFRRSIMTYAMDNWPISHDSHVEKGDSGPYHYEDHVYKGLGL